MMNNRFCFILGFRNGAVVMSVASFLTGIGLFLLCVVNLANKTSVKYNSMMVIGLVMGQASLVAGVVLALAIIKGKERYVLLYILLESVLLLVVTIYSGMFVFTNLAHLPIILLCGLLWLGVHGMYGFYLELAEYNASKPGVYEISYTDNAAYTKSPSNGLMENTAV